MLSFTRFPALGYLLVGALYFIWPIPHTIGLRFNLLALTLIYFFLMLRVPTQTGRDTVPRQVRILLSLIGVFTLWMVANALWISNYTSVALGEISGQWLTAILSALLGVLAAKAANRHVLTPVSLVMTMVLALALHSVALNLFGLHDWIINGGEHLDRLSGLTEGPDKSNFLNISFLGFVFCETYLRLITGARFLRLSNITLSVFITLAMTALYWENTRNGIVPVAAIFLTLLVLYTKTRRANLSFTRLAVRFFVVFTLLVAGIFLIVKTDARWHTVLDSARLAWQTTNHSAAFDHKQPVTDIRLPSGKPAEQSTYLRAVMVEEGLEIVAKHPFGIGYGRNAFGYGLKEKYGFGAGHSHSGALDLAIGVGIPGLVMGIGIFTYVLYLGIKLFIRTQSYASLALTLMVISYLVRLFFDSIVRDHMLQQFMFSAALLLTLALNVKNVSTTDV